MENIKTIVNSMYTPDLTYTYDGNLNLDLIEPITVGVPAITDLFRVIQGVRCGEYLHYLNPLTQVLSKSTGDCNPVYTQAGSITDRRLETGEFKINLEWCEAEFTAVCTALIQKYIKPGVEGYELEGALMNLIFKQVLNAAKKDIMKVTFFGDNSLGAGSSSIYSVIDGVFTKFFDAETAYCVRPVDNSMGNAHNSTLAADKARDILEILFNDSSIQLMQMPNSDKEIWTTGSFYNNYYKSVINNCCVDGSWEAGQNGINVLKYRGIELKPLWFADESLGAASNVDGNPFYDEIRHFAVYTAKDNHIFGTERSSDLGNLTSCLDCRTNSNLIKGKMRFGYNFAQCDLISWAK